MDPLSIVLAVGLGLLLGWLMVRNKNVDFSKIKVIKKSDFKDNMRKGQLIDIRKKDAFKKDKIKGARNFTVTSMTGKYAKLRKDKSIYLYCQNGKKSKRIAKKLVRSDYNDIYVLEGGLDNYNQK